MSRSLSIVPDTLLLHSSVQHYAWGDPGFLPDLLGVANPQRMPYAELWMGSHPDLPSQVEIDGQREPLDRWIGQWPEEILGLEVARRYGPRLPYLLKILSAAAPLSIQAHPSKRQAADGFQRENSAGIPLSAGHRNYKDDNHKPELIAALTDFFALCGFRPLAEIEQELQRIPELRSLQGRLGAGPDAIHPLYADFMSRPQAAVDALLDPLVRRWQAEQRTHAFSRQQPEYWMLRADQQFSRDGHRDRGLLSVLLLNLVHLQPGEALYLPAGVLHAYLEGAGVEIMANSNNVLRGGLTPEHVDVPELLRTVVFVGDRPEILRPVRREVSSEFIYRTEAAEFQLSRIDLTPESPFAGGPAASAEIVLVTETATEHPVRVQTAELDLILQRGQAALVRAGAVYRLTSKAPAKVFRARVGG